MTDPVGDIARATAARLGDSVGERELAAHLEAELGDPFAERSVAGLIAELDHDGGAPRAYADPVSIASLIVAIASLAWNIYTQRRRSPQELAGEVRTRWAGDHAVDEPASTIIDVVAEETVKHGER